MQKPSASGGLFFVFPYAKLHFKEISPTEVITQAAQRQQFVDQSQSLNLNIPADLPIKDVNQMMIDAWKKGVKTLYYQRSQSVSKELMVSFATCSSCEA